jgi:hypothetical protein
MLSLNDAVTTVLSSAKLYLDNTNITRGNNSNVPPHGINRDYSSSSAFISRSTSNGSTSSFGRIDVGTYFGNRYEDDVILESVEVPSLVYIYIYL